MERAILGRNPILARDKDVYIRKSLGRATHLDDLYHKQLERRIQRFTVRAESDNLIRGRAGVELEIPAASFVDPDLDQIAVGEVVVELVELAGKADMLLTNRPTTSRGELLETGGAFAFSARQYHSRLQLRRPVTARMPVSDLTTRPDLMSVFAGPLRPFGNFDWNLSGTDRLLNADSSREEGYYSLRVRRPNWINCDYFYRQSGNAVAFRSIMAKADPVFPEQHAFVLFKDINAVARMRPFSDGFAFQVPEGMEATLVVLATDESRYFFGAVGMHTSEGPEFEVLLHRVAESEIAGSVVALLA